MNEHALILQSVYKPFTYPIWKSLKGHHLIVIQSIELQIESGILPRNILIECNAQSSISIDSLEMVIHKSVNEKRVCYKVPSNLIDCNKTNLVLRVIPTEGRTENIEGLLIVNFKEFPKDSSGLEEYSPKPVYCKQLII